MRWYLSAAAVRQWQRIAGIGSFSAAEHELRILADAARLVADVTPGGKCQTYRVRANVGGKRTRLEFAVSLEERAEGELPQLIHVRNKG